MIGVLPVSFDGAVVGISFAGARRPCRAKSRKRNPDVHAFTVFKFLMSRLRFLKVVMILEASDDSPRDFQGRLPKED